MSSANSQPPAGRPPGRRRFELAVVGAIFLGVLWSYVYIGLPPGSPVRFDRENLNYYNQLADGFLFGRAGFKLDPPKTLVALADPYEPKQRAAAGDVGLHDATYFKGRYYLYFGVAPAVCLNVPFKLLTGLHFPQGLTTVVFCTLGFLTSLVLMLRIRHRLFPAAGCRYLALGAIMLGLGNLSLPMLARNSIWEVPISAAYWFSSLGFLLLFEGLHARRRRLYLLAGANAAFGLAVASRPHYVFAAFILAGLWLGWTYRRRRKGPLDRAALVREAAAVLIPFSAIVVALLAYNYARFESIFEFGQKYQLSGNRQIDSQLMSPRFLPINFYHYVLAPLQFEGFFPFVEVIRGYPGTRPADYGGAENPFGILPNLPVSWLGLLLPLLWLKFARRPEFDGARAWTVIFLGCFAGLALIVMCFAWSANRYMMDFFPTLLFASLLGMFVAAGARSPALRKLAFCGMFAAVSLSAAVNLLLPVRNQTFVAYRPEHFSTMARWLNQPTFLWDQWRGVRYGPVEFDVRFPPARIGKAEPIVVAGASYKAEYLHAYYPPGQKSVQFFFTRTNRNQVVSQPVALDYDRRQTIGIDAGFLYPPPDHPFWQGWSEAAIREKRETLRLTVDGVTYLDQRQEFFPPAPKFVRFGENPVSDYTEKKFTGEMGPVRRRAPDPERVEFPGGSFLRLGLVLPRDAVGRREALVRTGNAGSGDVLSILYEREDRIRFVLDQTGGKSTTGPGVTVKPGDIQLLEFSLGSFYPSPKTPRDRELAGLVVVRVNGETVWRAEATFGPPGAGAGAPEVLPAGGAGVSAAFSGRIAGQRPFAYFPATVASPFSVQPFWVERGSAAAYGPVRVHFRAPSPATPRPQPMVVTGHTGAQADFVYINFVAARQVQFGYVHSGYAGGPITQPAAYDPARVQILEVSMPSLYPDEFDEFFAYRGLDEIAKTKKAGFRIRLNGAPLLDAPVRSYPARAETITVGTDRLAQAFGPRFSGDIVAVEREHSAPPPGLDLNSGPLALTLRFPEFPLNENEPLLATGDGRGEDVLLVRSGPGRQRRFVVKTRGQPESVGEAFTAEDREHKVEIHWGGLYPDSLRPAAIDARAWRERQSQATVTVDGKPVLRASADFLLGESQNLSIGRAAKAGASFSGRIISVERLPVPAR